MFVSGVRMLRPSKDTLIPLCIFAAIGAVSATFLSIGATRQEWVWGVDSRGSLVAEPFPPGLRYFGVLTNWDGQWYRSIAEAGYPATLPLIDGRVAQNAWAFYPLYPMLVRAVMTATTLDFAVSAWLVTAACASCALVLLYRLVLPRMGRFGAGALVACLAAYPASPLLQVAYAESLALLLVVLVLAALRERRYGRVLGIVLALALARPIVLPMAAVIGVHWVMRWRASRRGDDPFPLRSRVFVALIAGISVALLGLWPVIAAVGTGTPDAYLVTLAAWPVNHEAGGVLGGWLGEVVSASPLGWVAVLGALTICYIGIRRGSAVWGPELRSWAVVYPLYLIAATRPNPSILRYLLIAIAPLWPLPEVPSEETRTQRVSRWAFLIVLLAFGLFGQFLWSTKVFTIDISPAVQPYP